MQLRLVSMSLIEKYSPLHQNVIIQADPFVFSSPGGVVLPETVNPNEGAPARTGTVVAVGARYNEITGDDLQAGERVAFQIIGSKQVEYKGDEYFIIRDTHNPRGILARIVD